MIRKGQAELRKAGWCVIKEQPVFEYLVLFFSFFLVPAF